MSDFDIEELDGIDDIPQQQQNDKEQEQTQQDQENENQQQNQDSQQDKDKDPDQDTNQVQEEQVQNEDLENQNNNENQQDNQEVVAQESQQQIENIEEGKSLQDNDNQDMQVNTSRQSEVIGQSEQQDKNLENQNQDQVEEIDVINGEQDLQNSQGSNNKQKSIQDDNQAQEENISQQLENSQKDQHKQQDQVNQIQEDQQNNDNFVEESLDDLLEDNGTKQQQQQKKTDKKKSSQKIMDFIKNAPKQIAKKNSQSFRNFKQQQTIKFEEKSNKNALNDLQNIEEIDASKENQQKNQSQYQEENENRTIEQDQNEVTFKPQQLSQIQQQSEYQTDDLNNKSDFQRVFNKQDQKIKAFMLEAIETGDLNMIKTIVKEYNFDPNEELGEQGCGQTCLHFSSFFKKKEILQFFLFLSYRLYRNNFQDIMNLQTQKGNTALMIAFELKQIDLIELFFKYGGLQLNLQNEGGESIKDIYSHQELNFNQLPVDIIQLLTSEVQNLEINLYELDKSCPQLKDLLFTNSQTSIDHSQQLSTGREQNDGKSKSVSNMRKNQKISPTKSYQSNQPRSRPISSKSLTKITQYQKQKMDLQKQLKLLEQEIDNLQDDEVRKSSPEKPGNYKKRFETEKDQNVYRSANELVVKMRIEKKQREKKYKDQQLLVNAKMQEQIEQSKRRQLELKKKLMEEKHTQIKEKIEFNKQKKQEQKQFNIKANELIKELKKNKNFEQKIKQKHQNEVEMPELERRKQILQEKRKIHQPVNYQEIQEHSKKHDYILKQKIQENQKERILQGKEHPHERNFFYKPIKSSFTEKLIQEEKLKKEKENKVIEEKRQLLERRRKYGELVKDIYTPQQQNIVNQSHAVTDDPNSPQSHHHHQQKPHETTPHKQAFYLSANNNSNKPKKEKQKMFRYYLKPKNKEGQQQEEGQQQQDLSQNNSSNVNRSPPKKKKQLQQQEPEKPVQKINYISQLRKMREKNQQNYKQENWNKVIHDKELNLSEKYTQVVQKVNRMENLAQMKELSSKQDKDMENMEKVNNLYIDSIKAKLALLDQIKDQEKKSRYDDDNNNQQQQ